MQSPLQVTEILYKTLDHFWGFNEFRKPQEKIICSLISGKDTLALLPTGGGKSLCYQLPALVLEGTCIVISPLLALMRDQVEQLKARNIKADFLSSELDENQEDEIYESCISGITKLLYISPERILNKKFIEKSDEFQISFIAVDEAHCISEWGNDFRPSYQHIKTFRQQFKNVPCLALTATATPKVVQDIQDKLKLKNADIYQKSFKRENIKIIIQEVSNKYEKVYELLKNNHSSGVIYTRTRKEAQYLCEFLQSKNLQNVDYFHAGLSSKEKKQKQEKWLKNSNEVLVSTNAFGMGIDKENVRFIIHLSPSASIENYYQEIGRAGRDGKQSSAFLFWNTDEILNVDNTYKEQIPNKKEFQKIVSYLYSYFQIADLEYTEETFEIQVSKIQNLTKLSQAKINSVLNFLHNQEIIFLNTFKKLSSIALNFEISDLELLLPKDSFFVENLLRNIEGLSSQKAYFSELQLSRKLGVNITILKDRLRELKKQNLIEYLDGDMSSVRFLVPRNDRAFSGKWWSLYEQIQRNKLLKWEEMKFYIQNRDYCKMKLILSYFGEKTQEDCNKCSVCDSNYQSTNGAHLHQNIMNVLQQKPSTLEEIAVNLVYFDKEEIQNTLITLLDVGKIKMMNFKTYMIA